MKKGIIHSRIFKVASGLVCPLIPLGIMVYEHTSSEMERDVVHDKSQTVSDGITGNSSNKLYCNDNPDLTDADYEVSDKRIYDKEGYDNNGYDRFGFDRDGYNVDGFDAEGFDKKGYNKFGFNRQGYDFFGYDFNGYNKWGYNREGFNREGFNASGYDKRGYSKNGIDYVDKNSEFYEQQILKIRTRLGEALDQLNNGKARYAVYDARTCLEEALERIVSHYKGQLFTQEKNMFELISICENNHWISSENAHKLQNIREICNGNEHEFDYDGTLTNNRVFFVIMQVQDFLSEVEEILC